MKTDLSTDDILNRMFYADGTDKGLSSIIAGRSGSGKTYLMTELINEAVKQPNFKNARIIYVSVKNESYWPKIEPTYDIDSLFKNLEKNSIAVFYPQDPNEYESELDNLIERTFNVSADNEETSFCIVVDDCNVLDKFNSQSRGSKMLTKAAIAGRSYNIKLCLVVHRVGNLPRMLNSSLNCGIIMKISDMDNPYSIKVLSLDLDPYYATLANNQYSWAFADLLNGEVSLFEAI
jgi:DNA helicase HerA-like ATPase